jgi:hypothetical protein
MRTLGTRPPCIQLRGKGGTIGTGKSHSDYNSRIIGEALRVTLPPPDVGLHRHQPMTEGLRAVSTACPMDRHVAPTSRQRCDRHSSGNSIPGALDCSCRYKHMGGLPSSDKIQHVRRMSCLVSALSASIPLIPSWVCSSFTLLSITQRVIHWRTSPWEATAALLI